MIFGQQVENPVLGELFPDATFICKNRDERCGYSILGAGDVNGDGFDDFMVAAYHNYLHGWNSGCVYLITGALNITWGFNTNIENAAIAIFRGSDEYDMVGYNVAGKGDFNGDGLSDLIIGAPGTWDRNPATPGWVYIVFGKKDIHWGKDCQLAFAANVKLVGENNLDQFGYANSYVGDINHDGFDDIICSAAYRNEYKKWDGKAYLVLGDSTGWHEADLVKQRAVASFVYPSDGALVGYSVAGVGDVNQDGTPDFVIGVPGVNIAFLILGRPVVDWGYDFDLNNADYKFIGEYEGDFAGSWISYANDINKDGYSDFLISASQSFFNGGRIYLILGRDGWESPEISLSNADASFRGEDVENHNGFCTSGLKDYDGDGYDDFLIGARYLNSSTYPHAGKMYLIHGRKSGWEHDYNLEYINDYFWGDDSITCAGWQVADVGDINGDNAHDIVTSGSFNSTGAHWGGKIYFFYGKNISHQINGSIKYYSKNRPISIAKLVLNGFYVDSTSTNCLGNYSFFVKPDFNYQIIPSSHFKKNVDDLTVSAYDAALVARHVVKFDTLDHYSELAADVDQDQKVCMYDAAQIARFAVDLPLLDGSHIGEFLFNPKSRFYERLNSSYHNEDYIGLILGDVDGDWQMTNSQVFKTLSAGLIMAKSIIGLINSKISIPIAFSDQEKVISTELQVLYDTEQLEFISLKQTKISKDFSLVYNHKQTTGSIKIALYTVEPVNINGEIIKLEFKGINKKQTNVTQLQVISIRMNKVKLAPGKTIILLVDRRHLNIAIELSNQPNPFNPTTNIIFKNVTSGEGKLIIYDMLGKVVRTFDLGYLFPGAHEQFWDGRDKNGIELASGVYFIKFICEKDVSINKMIKLK
jgi:hypothetical protein